MSLAIIEVRSYRPSDLPGLQRIYRDAIRTAGGQYYSADQIAAWSSFADTAEFGNWIAGARTYVAVDEHGRRLGFGGWQPHGRISALFVTPEAMRQGVGTALVRYLLGEIDARGLGRITTEASEFSRPLFEKFGFRVTAIEHNEVRGVTMTRYAMVRQT